MNSQYRESVPEEMMKVIRATGRTYFPMDIVTGKPLIDWEGRQNKGEIRIAFEIESNLQRIGSL